MSSRKSSKLPGVSELRAQLDYGDKTLERCKYFYEDCRFFLRHYINAEGVPGSQFYDRASRDHLDGIERMTEVFLQTEDNGNYWWPSDRDHRNANKLQYGLHQNSITQKMRLLFLKINRQSLSNTRYKSKIGAKSMEKPLARHPQPPNRDQSARGSSVNDPIDVENAYHQSQFVVNRPQGAGQGQRTTTSSSQRPESAPATPAKNKPGQQPPRASSTQDAWRVDLHAVPSTLELSFPPNAAPQSSPSRERIAHSEPPAAADCTNVTIWPSAASAGTKRAATADTQRPRKKPKVKIHVRRSTTHNGPEQTPQRKSSRKKSQRFDNLAFDAESPAEAANEPPVEAVAGNAVQGQAASEAASVAVPDAAPEPVPITVQATVPEAPNTMQATAPDAVADFVQAPVQATLPDAVADAAQATALDTVPGVVQTAAPNSGPDSVSNTAPGDSGQQDTDESRAESLVFGALARDIVFQLARQREAEEAPGHHAAITETPDVDSYLFRRVNALCDSETSEERHAQILEELEQRARVPEAPMAVFSDTELPFPAVGHQSSPPPPEMGNHEWKPTDIVPLQSTEHVGETVAAAGCTGTADTGTMIPEPVPSRVTPERSTEEVRPARTPSKSPDIAPEQHSTTAPEPEPSPAGPPPLPRAAKSELRLVVISGPKSTRSKWKPAKPFEDMTIADIKEDIPLTLSPAFRGFKFTFVGIGQRSCFEVQDGDDYELEHLKLDVEEVMENWKAGNQGSGKKLVVQLRIEELRDATIE